MSTNATPAGMTEEARRAEYRHRALGTARDQAESLTAGLAQYRADMARVYNRGIGTATQVAALERKLRTAERKAKKAAAERMARYDAAIDAGDDHYGAMDRAGIRAPLTSY